MRSKPSKPLIATGIVVAIAMASAAWYLVDLRRPVDATALGKLESAMNSTSLDLQQQLTTDIDARQLAMEKARSESPEGVQLAGLCNAWIDFDMNHPSDSTRMNRDRVCGEFRRFIETGELPTDPAE